MEQILLIVISVIVVLQIIGLVILAAIAASISKLIQYFGAIDDEPVVGSRSEGQGLQQLQDERSNHWGLHMSYDLPNYDLPNYDGLSSRPKNFDGVGESLEE